MMKKVRFCITSISIVKSYGSPFCCHTQIDWFVLYWLYCKNFVLVWCGDVFSRMRSEGSRFTWGSGGEAVFAEFCVCVRNRSQVSATVCVSAVRLSTVASVSGVVSKACQVELWRHSYIGVCSGGVCGIDLCRRSYIGVCRGGV